MAKQIPLTQGKVAWVDDEDYDWVMQWKWSALWTGYKWYAVRVVGARSNQKMIYLHREIMNAPDGVYVDHQDGDGLNNQRYNLRLATNAENMRNRGAPANNTSGYKGVCWDKESGKWVAMIGVGGRRFHLGRFHDIIEAARAYDEAAKKHHKDFAYANFPEDNNNE